MSPRLADRSPLRLIVLVAGFSLVAVGCGDSNEDGLERIIESQTSDAVDVDLGDNGDLSIETEGGDVQIDDGNITVTGADGEVITGEGNGDGDFTIESEDGDLTVNQGSEIPDEWPDEVPEPDGFTVTSSTLIDTPEGASVTIVGAIDDGASFVAAYTSTLEAAGFTKQSEFESDGAVTAFYDGAGWQVAVATSSIDGQNQGSVAVFPAG
jgi:hypothetical protein